LWLQEPPTTTTGAKEGAGTEQQVENTLEPRQIASEALAVCY